MPSFASAWGDGLVGRRRRVVECASRSLAPLVVGCGRGGSAGWTLTLAVESEFRIDAVQEALARHGAP